MLDIMKRTTLGTLLLLIMPVGVWLSGWQWHPVEMGAGYKALFWVTETVTRPWGIVTSVLFCGWFLWCLRFRIKPALILLLIVTAALLTGQYSKSYIKEQVQEPRPYVLWLEKTQGLNPQLFYGQDRELRSQQVVKTIKNEALLPQWLKDHWAFETGFAFPSGHTMFAASWALLGIGLLWPRRRMATVVFLIVWASGVMVSRLVLGMHWPRDLVTSTLISWLLVTLATWLVQRFAGPLTVPPVEHQEIEAREREN